MPIKVIPGNTQQGQQVNKTRLEKTISCITRFFLLTGWEFLYVRRLYIGVFPSLFLGCGSRLAASSGLCLCSACMQQLQPSCRRRHLPSPVLQLFRPSHLLHPHIHFSPHQSPLIGFTQNNKELLFEVLHSSCTGQRAVAVVAQQEAMEELREDKWPTLLQSFWSHLLLWWHPQLQAGLGEGFTANRHGWQLHLTG